MKNIAIAAILVAMASVGAIVACGGGTPPAASPDTASSASTAPTDSAAPTATTAPTSS
jgi:hypothetical protein